MQKITKDIKANEWGGTPDPTTNFGDDRWYNYSVSADILTDGEDSYAGIGLRYILADSGRSGYSVTLYENGNWNFFGGKKKVLDGNIADFDSSKWHNVKISALNNDITVSVDGEKIIDYKAEEGGYSAGRAALYSSYNNCCFDNVKVEATDSVQPYVNKFDNFDNIFTYSENGWEHSTMDSFKNYKRTISHGAEGAYFTVDFEGTGIILTGVQKGDTFVSIEVDGKTVNKEYAVSKISNRQSFLLINGLEQGSHTLKLTVVSGNCSVDAAQVLYDYEAVNKAVISETSYVAESTDSSDSVPEANDKSAKSNSGKGSFPFVPVVVGAAAVAAAIGAGVAIAKMKKKKD